MTTSIHPSIWTNQAPYRIALDALLHFQWSVFPLDEEKRPPKTGQTHPDGQPKRLSWKRLQTQWASTEEISHWHHTYKPAAWAIITGAISKIVLLDFDGEAGQQTRERLGLIHPHVQTGSGGHHVYFRHPGWPVPTLNSKSSHELGKRWPGLDIRADGGYAAFCGHNTSGQYLWLRDPDPEELEILPTELRRFLGLSEPPPAIRERFVNAARTAQPDHQQPDTVNITPTVQSSHQQPGTVNPTPTVSAQTLLSRATIALNNEGKGRNDTGFWLACQLRDNGYTRAYAQIIMREYVEFVPPQNTKGLFEPYTLEEAFASIASAYQGPARDPWSVPPPPALPRKVKNEEKNVGKFCPIRVVDLMAEFTQGDAPTPTPEGETQRSMDNEHTPGDATTPTPEGEVQCSMDTGHTPGDAPTPGSERQCSPATQSSGAYVEREDLPEIFIHQEQLRAVVDQTIAAIVQWEQRAPSLFLQSGRLVRIGRNDMGRPLLVQMSTTEVREMLTHVANFYRLRKIPGQSEASQKLPVSPPKELAELLLARQTQEPYLPFPTLSALIETPVIRPDGTLLDQPGYDPATRLYYTPLAGMETCNVPLQPTPEERANALVLLLSAIGEFPYVSTADKANALALLLTPILRPAIKRHVPLALIDAPKQGTGKGLLSDVVSIIATGTSAAIITLSNSEEELQKLITALLIEGATIITLDNVTGRLQSRHLDAALTSDMWHGRILGMSKMTFVPQRATWIATGNNIKLGGDLARRCYRIRLDAKVSRPFMRADFTHSDLVEWVSQHRTELVGALLTLARAWYAAGQPQYAHLPSLGTFSSWVKTVGGILEYAGVEGFLSNLERLYDDIDDDSIQWEAFLHTWHQLFGKEWISLSVVVREILSTDPMEWCEDESEPTLSETLPEALQIALKEKPQSFPIRLGKALERLIDTCFGEENIHIEKSRNAHRNTSLWRVSAGSGGSGGSDSVPTHIEKYRGKNTLWEE